jgi:Holliday junction resolvase
LTEQQIQKEIIKYLESIGAYTIKTIRTNRAGTPDIIACLDGKFIAIEVKRKGNKPTPLQLAKIEQIRASGGLAFVAYSKDDVINQLKELNNDR